MSRTEREPGIKDVDVEDTKHDLVSAEPAMFYALLSQNWYAVQLLPGWDFFKAYYEDMNNPLLILTLLKIISRDQW